MAQSGLRTRKSMEERLVITVKANASEALIKLDDIPDDYVCEPAALKTIAGGIRRRLEESLDKLSKLEAALRNQRSPDSGQPFVHFVSEEEVSAHDSDIAKSIFSLYHDHNEELVAGHAGMMQAHVALGSPKGFRKSTISGGGFDYDSDVMGCLLQAGSFEFDAIELGRLTNRPITALGSYVDHVNGLCAGLEKHGGYIEDASVFREAYLAYLGRLDELYRPEAVYHGACHAVDVMSTMLWATNAEFFQEWMSGPDRFMSLMAAAIHDVGHPGRNNVFYAKTWDLNLTDPVACLAVRYNDKSILENHHIALAFETLVHHEHCNWFRLLSKKAGEINMQNYIRHGLIDMVLHTDMSKHSKNSKQLSTFGEQHHGHLEDAAEMAKPEQDRLKDKLFILGSTLHAVDISNPTKPRPIMLAWTKRVLDEFWAQGDYEKSLGFTNITMMCDRDVESKKIPAGQLGFIGFVVEPYWKSLAVVIPQMQQAVDSLAANKAFWQERKAQDEGSYESLFN